MLVTIHADIRIPVDDGYETAKGYIVWEPSRRRVLNSTTILPAPFSVRLEKGITSFQVETTTAEWVWEVTEVFNKVPKRTTYFVIRSTDKEYSQLTPIDPETLSPEINPVAAWWAVANANIIDAEMVNGELLLTRYNGEKVSVGNVRGPQGTPGVVTYGEWFTGEGPPTEAFGEPGDMYIDTNTGQLYKNK